MHSGNGPRSHLRGWLYRIARNLLVDHYRARDRREIVALDNVAPWLPALVTDGEMEQEAIAAEARALINRAINGLPPLQAEVMRARMAGCDFAEIGAALGKSEGATKAYQHRALTNLRRLLVHLSESDAFF